MKVVCSIGGGEIALRGGLLLFAIALCVPVAAAQDFSGTYRDSEAPDDRLVLSQDKAGVIEGAFLEDGDRVPFRGSVKDGVLTATVILPDGTRIRLRGTLEGDSLRLSATPLDEQGRPIDLVDEVSVVYQRLRGGPRPPPPGADPNAGPAPRRDRFVGTFVEERLTVVLKRNNDRYTGTFTIADQTYPVEARARAAGGIEGAFEVEGKRFRFEAGFAGGLLALRSGGTLFQLKRETSGQEPGNPLAGGSSPKNPLGAKGAGGKKGPKGPRKGYKITRHSLGLAFEHPETWQATETPTGMTLTPPDVQQAAWGAAEFFLISAAPANGIENPGDPRVHGYIAGTLMRNLGVPVQPEGRVEKAKAGTRDLAIMTWRGSHPNFGGAFRVRAYVVLISGYGVTLTCIGSPAQIDKRDKILREIVTSLSYQDPNRAATADDPADQGDPAHQGGRGGADAKADPRFVGRWYRTAYSDSSITGMSTSFHQTMILAPDGKLSWVDQTVISGERRAGGASPGWTFSGIPESEVNRGRWSVTGERMAMTWQGGGIVYTAYVQGSPGRREMLLTPVDGGKKELWTEYAN